MNDVTIIMGAYNCDDTISEAIDSLLLQTYTNWLLVVCDDCSSDNTLVILQEYQERHKNIRVLRNKSNQGLASSLNHCLKHVSTKYVARMDGDDLCHPARLATQVAFLNSNPKYSIVSTAMELFDENGSHGIVQVIQEPSKSDFIFGTPHIHAPMMMKSEALLQVNGYNSKLRRAQDYDLWSRLYAKGHVGFNLSEPLYLMRDGATAISRRGLKTRLDEVKLRFTIFRRLNISPHKYIFCLKPLIPLLMPTFMYQLIRSKKHKL